MDNDHAYNILYQLKFGTPAGKDSRIGTYIFLVDPDEHN
jgi:hypothetical protein